MAACDYDSLHHTYDVRVLLRSYAMYFGELREVGESFSSHNPGLGLRFLSIDKYIISMSRTEIVNTVVNIILLV